MRNQLAIAAVLLLAGTVGGRAEAKDLTGRVGLGYEVDMPGLVSAGGASTLNAISARYWVNQDVGLSGQLGYQSISQTGGNTLTAFGIGIGGLYNFVKEPNMNVHGLAALSFGSTTVGATPPATGTTSKSTLGFSVGLGTEFFLSGLPNLGFSTAVGISYASVSDIGSQVTLGGADFATVGIRYYFGEPKGGAPAHH